MFEKFKNINDHKILIIGDIILDKYIHGDTHRISPEAPVPIVLANNESYVLGGAANVAMNLASLGAESILMGSIGDDDNGNKVVNLVNEKLQDTSGILFVNKITTTKTRVVSKGQQLLRIDNEDDSDLLDSEIAGIYNLLVEQIESNKITGIILQDYNKGLFTKSLIEDIIVLANNKEIPVFVDPKHKNFWEYKGVTIFKPNLSEIEKANDAGKSHSIEELLMSTSNRLGCEILMCTLADKGVAYIEKGIITKTPTQRIDVIDVSGAGDSALAIIAISYLLGYDTHSISILANLCGKIVCMKSGVSTLTIQELRDAYKGVYQDNDK